MVTPLDISLLRQFDVIFPFLFIVTIVYAILVRMDFFENKTWAALIAFSLAIVTSFSKVAVLTINYMAPWIVLIVIMLVMILLTITALGGTHQNITDVITAKDYDFIIYIIIGVVLIVGFGSFAKAVVDVGGGFGVPTEGTPQEIAFYNTIFHPQVLGLILIMIIAFFTIMKISGKPK